MCDLFETLLPNGPGPFNISFILSEAGGIAGISDAKINAILDCLEEVFGIILHRLLSLITRIQSNMN